MDKIKRIFGFVCCLLCLAGFCFGEETLPRVRKPVFAGSFYPAQKKELAATVDGCLKKAATGLQDFKYPIFGLISPHAGYQYSARVAAYGYSLLKGRSYHTVILMGPSHRVYFYGVAIYPSGLWQTPLNLVPVDEEAGRTITRACPFVRVYESAFEEEHSLEVQLPFLQETLKEFKIVPLVFGQLDDDDFEFLAETLLRMIRNDPTGVLVVASSDMSHYHPDATARLMDNIALEDIKNLDTEALFRHLKNNETELCGAMPVLLLMKLSRELGCRAKILKYANSGDSTGDKSSVVGYGSTVFYFPRKNPSATPADSGGLLDKTEQQTLLRIVRNTLKEYLSSGKTAKTEVPAGHLVEKRGVFVTLKKNGNLRGCIGYIHPVSPLYQAVSEMAIAAATQDPRFPAVSPDELKDIKVEITVLTPLKLIDNTDEIQVGRDGIYISKGFYSGILLPQVATENGWNRNEFLCQTCLKAGLSQDAWKEKDTRIYIFSGQIFSE